MVTSPTSYTQKGTFLLLTALAISCGCTGLPFCRTYGLFPGYEIQGQLLDSVGNPLSDLTVDVQLVFEDGTVAKAWIQKLDASGAFVADWATSHIGTAPIFDLDQAIGKGVRSHEITVKTDATATPGDPQTVDRRHLFSL